MRYSYPQKEVPDETNFINLENLEPACTSVGLIKTGYDSPSKRMQLKMNKAPLKQNMGDSPI